jgi:hypothetical protein
MFSRAPRYLLVLALVATSARASTTRHDRRDFDYTSSSVLFTSVGRFDGSGTTKDTHQPINYIASGTLIAPDWVVTAGHVVDIADSLTFTINNAPVAADAWLAHPQWTGDLTTGYDIGLVHLSTAVDGVTPANLYKGGLELGKIGTYVGYGKTGTGLTGATTFDGQKRAAQNMVDAWFNNVPRILMSDFDNPNPYSFDNMVGSKTPLYLEGLIAPGDSGGGLFITGDDGKRYLAGVNSFVGASIFDLKADSDYGDFSGATRVTWFVPWISNTMANYVPPPPPDLTGESASAGLAASAAIVPEPGAMAVLLGALMPALRRRPRRRN